MALIKCKECGHEVSTEAKTCPNCGAVPKKKGHRGLLIALIPMGIVLIMIAVGEDADKDPLSNATWGQKLACLDANTFVPDTDARAKWFDNALKTLKTTYGKNGEQISDGLLAGKRSLAKFGVQMTLRQLAELMKGVTAPPGKTRNFEVIMASYVTFRKNGTSHREAAFTIQELARKMP